MQQLDKKLSSQGYLISSNEYHKELFGSRYCTWVNKVEKMAIRLVWDGKDSWFVLEESTFIKSDSKFAWADIGIHPFDQNNFKRSYQNGIVESIVNETI